jgi:hypothetical protein
VRAEPECNRSYAGSNLVRNTGYPKVSRGFPHSIHLNTRKLPKNRPLPLPSKSFPRPNAAATFEPETTQQKQAGQTPDREAESKDITVYVRGYIETDPTGILSPPTVWC